MAHCDLVEPDWKRLPGFRGVDAAQWHDPRWQRVNTVRNVSGLRAVFGHWLDDLLAADLARDQEQRATMGLSIPPQMLNTMDERDLRSDPVRSYMAPAFSERDPDFPSHPFAARDSLKERDMWAVEGLTHRYPTKVLAELVQTCPQYCGHCTRMDLVGPSIPQVTKYRLASTSDERLDAMLGYVREQPQVRDVVVSGGDAANVPINRLERFVAALIEVPQIREIRIASKALIALPQHFLQDAVRSALERLAFAARRHGVSLSLHTHANHANQITPLVARTVGSMLDLGLRDVRNQAVLLRGVNADAGAQLALAERLLYDAQITPYYVYMCDVVPGVEHWRVPLSVAQEIQQKLMGRLPGYATPRLVCDVPLLGKKWVHQVDRYDVELGISSWSKHYSTAREAVDGEPPDQTYLYYDPLHALSQAGREWWAGQHGVSVGASR